MSQLQGFLNLNKPSGLTSHDLVARVRRLVGRGVKVGHAGTLDPSATGVLPIALGAATRLIEYLAEARKGYHGLVRLGVRTTTDDAEGEILETCELPLIRDAQIEAAVAPLRGAIMQLPPHYSALHQDGQRLYALARAGQPITLVARPVMVERLVWQRVQADLLAIEVVCGKGTYIRSLARDLGVALGCGAHLAALTRTFVGPFQLDSASSLEQLMAEPELLQTVLLPPAIAVADWPAVYLASDQVRRVIHGMSISLPDLTAPHVRAHTSDGTLLALLRRVDDHWQPEKVLVGAGSVA